MKAAKQAKTKKGPFTYSELVPDGKGGYRPATPAESQAHTVRLCLVARRLQEKK